MDRSGRTDDVFSVKEGLFVCNGVELVGPFLVSAVAIGPGSPEIVNLDRGVERDVWISWRPLTHPAELELARWAIVAGAAILVEPGERLHPELFAWARPTMVSGSAEELHALAEELERLAPRLFRRRWLRQRGERLRLLLVEGEPSPAELQQVVDRWSSLSPHHAPRCLPFFCRTLV